MQLERVPRRYRRVSERFVQGNRVQLLNDGAEAFPAMLEAIVNARQQVLLEMYWFDSDRVGREFADALSRAAERGVEVAVLYDSLGSWEADPEMFTELQKAGVRVIEFNPIAPWRQRFKLARLTRRNHRKMLVADGEVGFTGGINLCDHWLPPEEGGGGWRDEMVRVEGPAVSNMVDSFAVTWRREGGGRLLRVGGREHSKAREGSQSVRVLFENHRAHRHQIVRAYLYNIYRAKKSIWIKNSYFIPEPSVVRALKRAAKRGVDVRVVLPAFSDVEIVRHAGRAVYKGMLRHGVRIFEWHRSVLHSKTAVIDGVWSTVGTFNLDYRSVRSNWEVNVAIRDEGFGAVMQSSFLNDLEQCQELDLHTFNFRPLSDRLLELILYAFRKLL
jgi:cardiolipin synthase